MHTKYVINTVYKALTSFIEQLDGQFNSSGETIYKVRNEVKVVEVDGLRLNVKGFKVPNLINRLAYSYIRRSKARRSFEYASRLVSCGVKTPVPVAWIEIYENGFISRSYYVCLQYNYDFTIRDVLLDKVGGKREILKAFTRYTIETLHRNGVFHLDYSPGNILIKREENGTFEFSLIDLNRMKFVAINWEKGLENLKQLHTSEENYHIIGEAYGEFTGTSPEACVQQLIEMSRKYQKFRSRRQRVKRILHAIKI